MNTPRAPSRPAGSHWQVVCLCADWCGTCREWRPALEKLARERPSVRFMWVDIEDQADALGDLDIETFPTLLIAQGATPRFLGPVLPHAAHVERLLDALAHDERSGSAGPEARELMERLGPGQLEPI
ncbi:thioredoxin family protein [Ramlibacter sp. AW1]|uniref:Thioredoxin family protein n=2 Tax=Ramlibacter aurantiacus TaxID=2801330 RepID=A0A936ZZD0_9BURK|nr:thioredoxin family protein [Ramlibacter aurantiacus]MBL0423239.1 thioredoxin family protein [Ramlibacter aurantiacus]